MGRRPKKHGDGDLFPLYATIDMPMLATSKKARTTRFKMGLSPSSKPNAMGVAMPTPAPADLRVGPNIAALMPTFNDVTNIPTLEPRLVAALARQSYDIILVDDISPDGTAAAGRALSTQNGSTENWDGTRQSSSLLVTSLSKLMAGATMSNPASSFFAVGITVSTLVRHSKTALIARAHRTPYAELPRSCPDQQPGPS